MLNYPIECVRLEAQSDHTAVVGIRQKPDSLAVVNEDSVASLFQQRQEILSGVDLNLVATTRVHFSRRESNLHRNPGIVNPTLDFLVRQTSYRRPYHPA